MGVPENQSVIYFWIEQGSFMDINAQVELVVEQEVTELGPDYSLKTMAEIIEFRAATHPNRDAFFYHHDGEDDRTVWTYRDLKNAVAFVAAELNKRDLSGEPVVMIFEPGLPFVAAFLAIISSGAVVVPCHPPIGKRQVKRLANLIENCEPAMVVYSTHIKEKTPQLSQLIDSFKPQDIAFTELDVPSAPEEMEWHRPSINEDDIAMLQYTSASTGEPKGVILTQANLIKNSEMIYKWLGPYPQRKGCLWLPPYHDMGLGGIVHPLYSGYPLFFMSPMHFVQKPLRWLKMMSDQRLTSSGAPNFAFQLCVDNISDQDLAEANLDLSSIREIFCGSEPINPHTMQAFKTRFAKYGLSDTVINPCYGMAETTLFVSGRPENQPINVQQFDRDALDKGMALVPSADTKNALPVVSCGIIGEYLDVKIVDADDRRALKNSQVGEIWVAGPSVAKGYWQKPELTKAAFGNRIAGEDSSGREDYFRTGDLGFYFKDELYITGRLKDMIIVRGRNLYPQDIERCAINASEQLKGSIGAAFSVDHEDTEGVVILVEVRGRPSESEVQAITDEIYSAVVGEFNVTPTQIVVGPPLMIHRTTSGKIQRHACKQAWLDGTLRTIKRVKK